MIQVGKNYMYKGNNKSPPVKYIFLVIQTRKKITVSRTEREEKKGIG